MTAPLPGHQEQSKGECKKTTVLLVDDHHIIRTGLRSFLETDPDVAVIGEAADGRHAIVLTRELHPDVVLMDIAMPEMDGINATQQIIEENPEQKVLMLTMHQDDLLIRQALRAGAKGYLLKGDAEPDLIRVIKTVAAGGTFFSSPVSSLLLKRYLGEEEIDDSIELLTAREREILQLIAEGNTNKEIAQYLQISQHTVETHRRNIMAKLDLHNTAELIRYAIQKRVVV